MSSIQWFNLTDASCWLNHWDWHDVKGVMYFWFLLFFVVSRAQEGTKKDKDRAANAIMYGPVLYLVGFRARQHQEEDIKKQVHKERRPEDDSFFPDGWLFLFVLLWWLGRARSPMIPPSNKIPLPRKKQEGERESC